VVTYTTKRDSIWPEVVHRARAAVQARSGRRRRPSECAERHHGAAAQRLDAVDRFEDAKVIAYGPMFDEVPRLSPEDVYL
jgi:hypothetical protein